MQFPKDKKDILLTIFSFLPGCTLFHKIATTSKTVRSKLPNAGLLDQIIQITIKEEYSTNSKVIPFDSLMYIVTLVDCF